MPRERVLPIRTALPRDVLAALSETYLTAWGSLVQAMQVARGQALLIRDGTSSVGMAAASLAEVMGLRVLATTRHPAKGDAQCENSADDVVIDTGTSPRKSRVGCPAEQVKTLGAHATTLERSDLQFSLSRR